MWHMLCRVLLQQVVPAGRLTDAHTAVCKSQAKEREEKIGPTGVEMPAASTS